MVALRKRQSCHRRNVARGHRYPEGEPPVVQVPGKRQFGLFAGLQANKGGIGAHISEKWWFIFWQYLCTASGVRANENETNQTQYETHSDR